MWQTRQVEFFHHSPVATEWRVLLTYLEYMEEAGEHLEKVFSVPDHPLARASFITWTSCNLSLSLLTRRTCIIFFRHNTVACFLS